jgi:hypothetical protein
VTALALGQKRSTKTEAMSLKARVTKAVEIAVALVPPSLDCISVRRIAEQSVFVTSG